MTRAAPWLSILVILSSIFACSSQSTGAAPGGPGGPGTAACAMETVEEKKPNSGPGIDMMQPLGTFDACKTLVVHGKLASGGNDGVRYTGDAGLFVFDVAAPGTLSVKVEWTATAVLDVVLYNDKQELLKPIPGTTSPSMAQGPLPAGKYILGVWSKDNPSDWTITYTWKKTETPVGGGSGGSCTSTLVEDRSGGCAMVLNEPANGQAITIPFTFGWSAQGCETPFTLTIFGSPPSAANSVLWKKSRTGTLANTAETVTVTAADMAMVTSDTGVYQWQVTSFYGATSPGKTFTLNGAMCK